MIKYRFYISANGGELRPAYPIYGDAINMKYALEQGQQFYRQELDGDLQFVSDDYVFIMSQAFDTKFDMVMQKTEDGATYTDYWNGYFYRADCTIDEDNKNISVSPSTNDMYADIMAGLDKEFNLIELAPATTSVTITHRPILQVHVLGDSTLTNIVGKMSWEQDLIGEFDNPFNDTTYHFALNQAYGYVYVDYNTQLYGGAYQGAITYTGADQGYMMFNGTLAKNVHYEIQLRELYNIETKRISYILDLVSLVDGEIIYSASGEKSPGETVLTNLVAVGGTATIPIRYESVYLLARTIMADVDTLLGNNTYDLPINDIVTTPMGYNKALGYGVPLGRFSDEVQEDPTKYGRNPDGDYYVYPYSIQNFYYIPIGQSHWGYLAIWTSYNLYEENLELAGRSTFQLRDASPLWSVISVLLAKIAPGITHEGTTEYSEFFYGGTNPLSQTAFNLLLTQKSNVLVGEYQDPAKKATIKLSDVLNMLSGCFQCYWYIDSNGKMRIEHISWFKSGGTYSGTIGVGADFTSLQNLRNSKKWAFGTSKYTYDIDNMPEQIQSSWMDQCTIPFDGVPIEVISGYVQKGNIEEITIGGFSPDVDMMMVSPDLFSKDGFCVMAAVHPNILTGAIPNQSTISPQQQYSTPAISVSMYRGEITLSFSNTGVPIQVAEFDENYSELKVHEDVFSGDGLRKTYTFNLLQTTAYVGYKKAVPAVEPSYINTFEAIFKQDNILPINEVVVDGIDYLTQNYILTMAYLQQTFWRNDLPASKVKINGVEERADGLRRTKTQELTVPVMNMENELYYLVKTNIGNGNIKELSLNLSSQTAKLTLNYEPE